MTDALKIAVKTALIAVVSVAIIAIFATVQIPNLDFTLLNSGLSTALAIFYHWVPASTVVFPIAVVLLGVQLAIMLFDFAMIATRWIFKVNE